MQRGAAVHPGEDPAPRRLGARARRDPQLAGGLVRVARGPPGGDGDRPRRWPRETALATPAPAGASEDGGGALGHQLVALAPAAGRDPLDQHDPQPGRAPVGGQPPGVVQRPLVERAGPGPRARAPRRGAFSAHRRHPRGGAAGPRPPARAGGAPRPVAAGAGGLLATSVSTTSRRRWRGLASGAPPRRGPARRMAGPNRSVERAGPVRRVVARRSVPLGDDRAPARVLSHPPAAGRAGVEAHDPLPRVVAEPAQPETERRVPHRRRLRSAARWSATIPRTWRLSREAG